MIKLKYAVAAAGLALSAGAANAEVVYADSVVDFAQGQCFVAFPGTLNENDCLNPRSQPENALGAPNNRFVALGLGGSLTVAFADATPASGEVTTFEVSGSRFGGSSGEAADLFAVLNGQESFIGTVYNTVEQTTLLVQSAFDSIKLVDVTLREFVNSDSFDGFDVDSVSIVAADPAPVPVPAAGLLLLAGIGGLGAMRRRQKNA